jgi:hypothetical protein
LNSIANSDSMEYVLQLLEEDISDTAFQAAIEELDASPALFESLVAVQFVKDALRGNCCPDRHYTAGIMRFIAAAEATRTAECGTERVPE